MLRCGFPKLPLTHRAAFRPLGGRLSVDNATSIVDQPRRRHLTKIGMNNTGYHDQGAFEPANNYFIVAVDGNYHFGAPIDRGFTLKLG